MSNKTSSYRLWPGKMPYWLWFLLVCPCAGFDLIDFIGSPIPFFGTAWDMLGTAIAYMLAGPIGLIYAWEIIAITPVGNVIDGFVPTLTIVWFLMYPLGMVENPMDRLGKRGRGKK